MSAEFDPYHKWLGIPPQDQPADHYRLLGLSHLESDPQVIESAADRQMVHLRTFANGPHSALSQTLLNEVAAARICLLNPAKKAAYDQMLGERLRQAVPVVVMAAPGQGSQFEAQAAEFPEIPIVTATPRALPTARRTATSRRPAIVSAVATLLILGVAIAYAVINGAGQVADNDTIAPKSIHSAVQPFARPPGQTNPDGGSSGTAAALSPASAAANSTADADDSWAELGKGFAATVADNNKVDLAAADQRGEGLSNAAAYPEYPPGQSVDLLANVDLLRHRLEGPWERRAEGLFAPAEKSRLRLPYRPAGSPYELRIAARRERGSGSLIVGLAHGDREFLVVLDRNASCYLSHVDGRRQIAEATWQRRVFEPGQWADIIITVQESRLSVVANNESLLDWTAYDRLSPHPDWNEGLGLLSLGWNEAAFTVSKLVLKPLSESSPGVVAGGVAPRAGVPATSIAAEQSGGESSAADSNGPKPIPAAAALTKAESDFRTTFADELAQAAKQADKVLLARELANKARGVAAEPAKHYVMLSQARQLAIEGGEVELALDLVGTFEQHFKSDFWPLRLETLTALSRSGAGAETKQALAGSCLQLADQAAAQNEFRHAADLCALSASVATSVKDFDQSKHAKDLQEDFKSRQKQWEVAERALETLEEAPDDGAANLAWGEYVCLVQGKWDEGLTYLAKGSDTKLREVAERELAKPNTSEARVEIGDNWFALANASKSDKEARQAFLARAKQWFERADDDLSMSEQKRVEKRVLDINEQLYKLSGGKGRASFPFTGLVGRVKVDGKDANVVLHYQPTKTFKAQALKDLLAKLNVKGSAIQIELVGALRLPVDTQAHFYVGGNSSGMVNQLYVAGAEQHRIDGSGRNGRIGMHELLRAGDYYIRWVIAGTDIDDCSMGFELPQNNWQPLPIVHTTDMLNRLRPQRAKAEVDVSSE